MKTTHTALPWHVGMKPGPMIYGPNGDQVADLTADFEDDRANAAFIVRACNAHDDLLAALDSSLAVQQFRGPQLHLLAAADALVPVAVSAALLGLQPDIEVGVLASSSHAFVLERPHELAAAIQAFLSEVGDD